MMMLMRQREMEEMRMDRIRMDRRRLEEEMTRNVSPLSLFSITDYAK